MFREHSGLQPKATGTPKSIYISYSLKAGFLEQRFLCDTVKQLKANNLGNEIRFDKDEVGIASPRFLSLRVDAIEKCKAAIVFLAESYFNCSLTDGGQNIFRETELFRVICLDHSCSVQYGKGPQRSWTATERS